eukprot:scaffold4753_cov66-Cyclotella_meneghiniana.AAC.2
MSQRFLTSTSPLMLHVKLLAVGVTRESESVVRKIGSPQIHLTSSYKRTAKRRRRSNSTTAAAAGTK